MKEEKTVLLVKPDGVMGGRVNAIREIIKAFRLCIIREEEKYLTPEEVIEMYKNISNVTKRDYFPDLVQYMTANPVHIFFVKGEDAISQVRKIIGKREPASGIRAWWSQDIIRNVAHGPHNQKEAEDHISLLIGKENIS